MDSPVRSVPVIQIRPNCIIEYEEYLGIPIRKYKPGELEELEKRLESAYSGQITDNAAKRLKKAINLLIMSTPTRWIYNPCTQKQQLFKIGFMTLTVSSTHSFLTARDAYDRLLKHFLQWLRRTKKVNNYVWRAELQKRGQIHYHLTIPDFINYNEIRDKWNELQRREGLLDDYFEEHGHYNPNSTDIHSVRNIKNLAGYICSYMSKEEEYDPVRICDGANDQDHYSEEYEGSILSCYPETTVAECRTIGKIWDCSVNLKKSKYWNTVMTQVHEYVIKTANEAGLIRTITGDRWKIHLTKKNNPVEILSDLEREMYNGYMSTIRNSLDEESSKN